MNILNYLYFFPRFSNHGLHIVSLCPKPKTPLLAKSIILAALFITFSFSSIYAQQADVYVLNGPNLYSFDANINNVTVDLSTADSIHSSISSIKPQSVNISDTPQSGNFDVDVTINVNKTRPIHPYYFGFNINLTDLRRETLTWHRDGTFAHYDSRFQTLLSYFRPGLLRFPGSEKRVYWTRDNDDDWDDIPSGYNDLLRPKDIDSFYELCESIGCELYPKIAHPTLNLADLSMTVDFIKYIKEKDYDIQYICMGNEPTIDKREELDGTEYANRFKQYYDAYRAIKPDLIFGAAETIRARSDKWTESWNPFFVEYMTNISDPSYQLEIVSSHYYQKRYNNVDSLLHWELDNISHIPHWTTFITYLVSLRDKYYPNALISVGEFGPSGGTIASGSEEAVFKSVGTALWAADVLGRAARAGADVMQFDGLTCSAGVSTIWPSAIFINDFSALFPIGYTYIMFDQWWGDDWITDVNSTDEGKLSVNGSVGDDGRVYVMLINKTENQDLTTRVSIQTGQGNLYFYYTAKAHSVTLVSIGDSQITKPIPYPVNLRVIDGSTN